MSVPIANRFLALSPLSRLQLAVIRASSDVRQMIQLETGQILSSMSAENACIVFEPDELPANRRERRLGMACRRTH